MRLAWETEVPAENLPRRHFVHHKSHLTRPGARIRAAAVGIQRLTAWAMALPLICRYLTTVAVYLTMPTTLTRLVNLKIIIGNLDSYNLSAVLRLHLFCWKCKCRPHCCSVLCLEAHSEIFSAFVCWESGVGSLSMSTVGLLLQHCEHLREIGYLGVWCLLSRSQCTDLTKRIRIMFVDVHIQFT
jgi:hypothetical protein